MRYHDITKDDMLNGDGLRVTLWLSGCDHKCEGCQNPLTWDPDDGLIFDENAKEELFGILKKPYISGITFSGGDPLYHKNREEVGRLISEIKGGFPDKTIWLYTGDVWEDICDIPFIRDIDVIVDGEFKLNEKDNLLLWKGSKNQRVIDVKESLKSADKTVVIRYDDYEKDKNLIDNFIIKPACCG